MLTVNKSILSMLIKGSRFEYAVMLMDLSMEA